MAAPVSNARFLQGLRVDDPVTDIILNANPILKSQVNDLTTIADATRRAVAAYAQPRTGIMNTPALTIGGGTTVGGMVGGTPGAIVGAVAPTVAGQTLTQLSSSQSLINRLLGNAGQNLLLTQPQNVRGGALIAPTASATGGLLNEPFRLDVSGTADTMSDEEKILAGLLQ
jgi:outer membrane lipoprotein SlyB